MLNEASLQRKEFKIEELNSLKKLDLNNIEIIKSDNLPQLLIWISELANYHYSLFLQFCNTLDNINLGEEIEEVNKKINFHSKSMYLYNQIKDFYLNKLLEQGDANVKGYIKHPIKKHTKYAVISYYEYDFVSFAKTKITEKFPIKFIDFEQKKAPKTLADIYIDEDLLLLSIKDFIEHFRKQLKKIKNKNRKIKEHNRIVDEVYKKIKNKEATLIKPKIVEQSTESNAKSKLKKVIPLEKKDLITKEDISKKSKSMIVVKKRKFILNKNSNFN